jgi:cytochrome c oxidase assembly protein Cox11
MNKTTIVVLASLLFLVVGVGYADGPRIRYFSLSSGYERSTVRSEKGRASLSDADYQEAMVEFTSKPPIQEQSRCVSSGTKSDS